MESRVTRYSKKNKLKRKMTKLFKSILKNMIYLIVGIFSAIYFGLKAFNRLIEKLFNKLPRIMKVAIIYLLIINLGLDIYSMFEKNGKEIQISLNDIKFSSIPTYISPVEEKEDVCQFDSVSCKISDKGKEIGLSEEQILISIAISKHETGNYTSYAFKELNNVGGMMCNSGLRSYDSLDDGIEAYLNNLKYNYFDIGLDTLEKIQPKYCPIGAANDPTGLNKYWLSGTQKKYNELIGK